MGKLPLIVIVMMVFLNRDGWDQLSLYYPPKDLEGVTISASETPEWLEETILNFTKSKEGFMRRPYICPAGMLTVGYGHVITKSSEFKTYSEKEATALLLKDFEKKKAWMKNHAPADCKDYQLLALTMLAANCRMHKWQNSALRQAVIEYIHIPNQECFGRLQQKWEAWSKIRSPKTKTRPARVWRSKALIERRHLEYLIFTGQWNKIRTEYNQYIPQQYRIYPPKA